MLLVTMLFFFFFQAEDGIRDHCVTGVQTCALPILMRPPSAAQSRAGAVAPTPRGFPVVACPDSIARDTRCLLLTHTSIITRSQVRVLPGEPTLRGLLRHPHQLDSLLR